MSTSDASAAKQRSVAGARRGWSLVDAVPGTTIRHRGGRTISDGEHVWLAWVTHNVSDVHGNADAAGRSEWGQQIVLGMLTAAVVIGLAEPAMTESPATGRDLGSGWRAIRLSQPVSAGDTLVAESHIEAVTDSVDPVYVTVRRTIIGRNQAGLVVARIQEQRDVRR